MEFRPYDGGPRTRLSCCALSPGANAKPEQVCTHFGMVCKSALGYTPTWRESECAWPRVLPSAQVRLELHLVPHCVHLLSTTPPPPLAVDGFCARSQVKTARSASILAA